MNLEVLEGLEALLPLDFFAVKGELPYAKDLPTSRWMRKHPLPVLLGQESFGSIALCWSGEGLVVDLVVHQPFQESSYPRYQEGDSFELFVDTRDLKTTQSITSFCHHFLFLPQSVQGITSQEVTRFRSEDRHPICSSEELSSETSFHNDSYEMRLKIPTSCLFGFDPTAFPKLGLSYRLNRPKRPAQLFSSSREHFLLEQHPRLWASFNLVR